MISTPRLLVLAILPVLHCGESRAQEEPGKIAFSIEDVLDLRTARGAALSPDGLWLAFRTGSLRDRIGIDNRRYGDPSYQRPSPAEYRVVDTMSGESVRLYEHRAELLGLTWSTDSNELAFLVKVGEGTEVCIWNRQSREFRTIEPPPGMIFAHDSGPQWLPNKRDLILSLRSASWTAKVKARFKSLTEGPVVVLSSEEPFLAWEDLRRMSLQKSLQVYDLDKDEYRELLPEMMLRSYALSEDGEFIRYQRDITEKTDYQVIFGNDSTVELLSLSGGEARELIPSTKKRRLTWARDGHHYAYAASGDLFFANIDDTEPRRLTGKEVGEQDEGEEPDEKKESFAPTRLSQHGTWLVASSKQGLYLIATETGERRLFLPMPEDDAMAPRHRVVGWSPDENRIYLSYASRQEWLRGFITYDIDRREFSNLIKDGHRYSGFQLAENGKRMVFSRSAGNRPSDLYATDGDFDDLQRLSQANPFIERRRFGKTELIHYLDADGNQLNGVLYYPIGYQQGELYPTICLVYEEFFDDNFRTSTNLLTANGYVVIQPSVKLEQGYPGEAWIKGVTAAANKLIEMGIADPERLAVQGTSYGGYATNLLITQTKRFKAAINVSGKVNMVSFYTDSPRLGVRNIHAPENSQDRIGATLWEQPQKYIAHSAIMDADRIETPLLLITGEQDHNVPDRQAMEMYYALRRLGKRVEWVRYVNGGHGTPTSTVQEVHDYYDRILAWYDEHLAIKPKSEASVVGNGH